MMTYESRSHRWSRIVLALIALVALSFAMGLAEAQEDHPAFGLDQVSRVTVETKVAYGLTNPDEIAAAIDRVESAAVAIILLQFDGTPLTQAEARALLRVQVGTDEAGAPVYKTDLQRCMEWIIPYQLRNIAVGQVVRTTIEAAHPVASDGASGEQP